MLHHLYPVHKHRYTIKWTSEGYSHNMNTVTDPKTDGELLLEENTLVCYTWDSSSYPLHINEIWLTHRHYDPLDYLINRKISLYPLDNFRDVVSTASAYSGIQGWEGKGRGGRGSRLTIPLQQFFSSFFSSFLVELSL